jgi:LPS export ABC transporter protein LptC
MNKILRYTFPTATIALWTVVVCFLAGCADNKPPTEAKLIDRSKLPRMYAENITTLISDSGITRYRISTPVWYVYDKTAEPYWYFPKGIRLERFDENYHIDGELKCKTARFYQSRQLWELNGKVRALNLQGEMFESEQLFWNQRDQKIYSDSLIRITQKFQVLVGKGFDSNQTMTKYVIRHPEGIFPVDPSK